MQVATARRLHQHQQRQQQQNMLVNSCDDSSVARSGSCSRKGMAGRPFSDGITLDDEAPVLPEKVSHFWNQYEQGRGWFFS